MFKRSPVRQWLSATGISLIDQLATIAIIGTIAGIGVPLISNTIENQRLGIEVLAIRGRVAVTHHEHRVMQATGHVHPEIGELDFVLHHRGVALVDAFVHARVRHRIRDAAVDEAVLLPEVQVGRHARLTKVVVDRGCRIPEGLVIGEDPELDAQRFYRSEGGVALVTADMLAALG